MGDPGYLEPEGKPAAFRADPKAKNGQFKCPKCGATDIVTNCQTGRLRCCYCRYEFSPQLLPTNEDIASLRGVTTGLGSQDIIVNSSEVLTLKCESCGAEVVINTAYAMQARCHWCRHRLSINKQVPNGAVPDAILPFTVTREEAKKQIAEFVEKRKFFAHPAFTRQFTADNISAVYFPYFISDINANDRLSGTGGVVVRKYTVKRDNRRETRYDVDEYQVERDFDIAIDDLTIEASADKLNVTAKDKTTNVINAIMPYDTKNCVRYNANYLRGCTAEKRDIDIRQVRPLVRTQAQDIARLSANKTLRRYDYGVSWKKEDFAINGESWLSAYFPVWLYSYLQVSGSKRQLHYVAVNARTKETMGSVPINMTKLIVTSFLFEFISFFLALFLGSDLVGWDDDFRWLLLIPGLFFFSFVYMKYRNAGERHAYEMETKRSVTNLRVVDKFSRHRYGLKGSRIAGGNNQVIYGRRNHKGLESIPYDLLNSSIDVKQLQEKAEKLVQQGKNLYQNRPGQSDH